MADIFEAELTVINGVAVVRVAGELDPSGASSFDRAIDTAIDAAYRDVVIDLEGVTFMGSTALHCLLRGHERALRRGLPFRIAFMSPFARRVLALSGLDVTLAGEPLPVA